MKNQFYAEFLINRTVIAIIVVIHKSFVNKRQKRRTKKFNAAAHHCIQNSKRNIWILSSDSLFKKIEISKVQIFKRSINEAYVLNRSFSIVSFSAVFFFSLSVSARDRGSMKNKQINSHSIHIYNWNHQQNRFQLYHKVSKMIQS